MKDFIKLVCKGICVILPVLIVCIYTWKNPLAYMDEEAPYYVWNREITNKVSEKHYKTVILGDSTANAAYMPEQLSDTTINLALGGATPFTNYYIMREWLAHHEAPDTCYISFYDNHFIQEDSFWTRVMYTHRFSFKDSFKILLEAVRFDEPTILTQNYWADFLSYRLWLPNKYITALLHAGFHERKETNKETLRLNTIHGGRYIARTNYEYEPTDTITYEQFRAKGLFDEYYKKLIRLCIDSGITVRLIKLPDPDNTVFIDPYHDEFYAYYKNIKKEFPTVTLDWFPVYAHEYFADAWHLNNHGALAFSTELKKKYPDDFDGDEFSMDQVNGINDMIVNENKIEYLFQWTSGRDYTLIVSDGTGKFKLEGDCNTLFQSEQETACDPPVTYLYGKNRKDAGINVWDEQGSRMLQLGNQEAQSLDIPGDDMVTITVIDHYNHTVLCTKSFRQIEAAWALQE